MSKLPLPKPVYITLTIDRLLGDVLVNGRRLRSKSVTRDEFYTDIERFSGMYIYRAAKAQIDDPTIRRRFLDSLAILPISNTHNTESNTMHNDTSIINDIVNAAKRGVIESNLIDQFKAFGDDIYEDGSILTWVTTFGAPEGKTYSYAAIKTPVGWAVTGKVTNCIDWYDLVGMFVTQHVTVADVYAATVVEGI